MDITKRANIITGNTLDDYMKKFGEGYNKGDLWDFSIEDVENGAIGLRDDIYYCKIGDRLYETPIIYLNKDEVLDILVQHPFILQKIYENKCLKFQEQYDKKYFYGTITDKELTKVKLWLELELSKIMKMEGE